MLVFSTPVLVMGANGRIGRLLARCWQDSAGSGVSPRWQSRCAAHKPDVLRFDPLRDSDALARAAHGVGAILVLAGVTPATAAAPEDYRLNTDLALAAVAACERVGVPRVLLCSSAAVYGRSVEQDRVLCEDGETDPTSDYGRAKLHMERVARAAASEAAVTNLRIGNVAGADQLLGPGRREVTLDMFEDGQGPRRSYIGPGTLGRVFEQLLSHPDPLPDCLNIAAPGAVDMAELLRMADIPFKPRPAPAPVLKRVELDVSRLSALVPLSRQEGTAAAIVRDWRRLTGGRSL